MHAIRQRNKDLEPGRVRQVEALEVVERDRGRAMHLGMLAPHQLGERSQRSDELRLELAARGPVAWPDALQLELLRVEHGDPGGWQELAEKRQRAGRRPHAQLPPDVPRKPFLWDRIDRPL